jgi:hypothetical protein
MSSTSPSAKFANSSGGSIAISKPIASIRPATQSRSAGTVRPHLHPQTGLVTLDNGVTLPDRRAKQIFVERRGRSRFEMAIITSFKRRV